MMSVWKPIIATKLNFNKGEAHIIGLCYRKFPDLTPMHLRIAVALVTQQTNGHFN